MHEHLFARFQSASRVKMWDRVSFREHGKSSVLNRADTVITTVLPACSFRVLLGSGFLLQTIELRLLNLTLTLNGNCMSTKGR